MYNEKTVVVVMPAYNAAKTLVQTFNEVVAHQFVDRVIVVDDASSDRTVDIAKMLPNAIVHAHSQNRGYGANQKTCYGLALEQGADIVVMIHPDYQYTPALLPAMVSLVASDQYDCVLASRILGSKPKKEGGMPWWRYVANRVLTAIANILMNTKLSEFHTGYRAYTRELLDTLPLEHNSNDYVFDNQILAQAIWHGFAIGEVSCPTRYTAESSSINFRRSVVYGLGCLMTALRFRLARTGLISDRYFERGDRN